MTSPFLPADMHQCGGGRKHCPEGGPPRRKKHAAAGIFRIGKRAQWA